MSLAPAQMVSFFKYVRSLGFANDPDYEYLYNLLYSVMLERKLVLDWDFDWLSRKSLVGVMFVPSPRECLLQKCLHSLLYLLCYLLKGFLGRYAGDVS